MINLIIPNLSPSGFRSDDPVRHPKLLPGLHLPPPPRTAPDQEVQGMLQVSSLRERGGGTNVNERKAGINQIAKE